MKKHRWLESAGNILVEMRTPYYIICGLLAFLAGFLLEPKEESGGAAAMVTLPMLEQSAYRIPEALEKNPPKQANGPRGLSANNALELRTIEDVLALMPEFNAVDNDFSENPFSARLNALQAINALPAERAKAMAEELSVMDWSSDSIRCGILSEILAARIARDGDFAVQEFSAWKDSAVKKAIICRIAESMEFKTAEDVEKITRLFEGNQQCFVAFRLSEILCAKLPVKDADAIMSTVWQSVQGKENLPFDESAMSAMIYKTVLSDNSSDAIRQVLGEDSISLDLRSQLVFPALVNLIHQQPQAALEFLSDNSDTPESVKKLMRDRIAKELTMENPNAAITLIPLLPESEQEETLSTVIDTLVSEDPVSALKLLAATGQHLPNPEFKTVDIGTSDIGRIMGELASDNTIARAFLVAWADSDPVALGDFLNDSGGQLSKDLTLQSDLAFRIAKEDPMLALQLLESLPNDQQETEMLRILEDVARVDPSKSFEIAASMESESRRDAYRKMAEGWMSTGPDLQRLSQWVDTLEGSDRMHAIEGLIDGGADQPELALALFERQLDDKQLGISSNMVRSLIPKVAASSPHTAAALVANLDEDLRAEGYSTLIASWVSYDPREASEWLALQPQSPARDQGILKLVESLQSDPEAAIAWIGGMADTRERHVQLTRLVELWTRIDGEFLRAVIRSSDLSVEEQRQAFVVE